MFFIFICLFFKINTNPNKINKNLFHSNNKLNNLNSNILPLSTNNFSSIMSKKKNSDKYLIIFYTNLCENCQNAIKTIEKVSNQFKNNKNIQFFKINCEENMLLSFQFNVTNIPYIILFENNKIYEFVNIPTFSNFINFINEKKTFFDSKKIPKINYSNLIYKFYIEFIEVVNNKINFWLKCYKINIKISKNFLHISIIIFLTFVLIILFNIVYRKYIRFLL
jgi:thiol-disulfide isomerase/thioredoxin